MTKLNGVQKLVVVVKVKVLINDSFLIDVRLSGLFFFFLSFAVLSLSQDTYMYCSTKSCPMSR